MPQNKVKIDSIRRPQQEKYRDKATLILKEIASERYLPIYISLDQADLLTKELTHELPPGRYNTPAAFLKKANATLSDIICITINQDNDIYSAKVLFYVNDGPVDVKCPIGVALSLADRAQVPILVNSEIMAKAALTVTFV
ncbi:MAG: bifunctional nuclease family protein [Dehalococcoidales bacterium]|nr:bifunctional nuclease family protein [Dehalococcoidales bacterium]